jgi:hypothetical protein
MKVWGTGQTVPTRAAKSWSLSAACAIVALTARALFNRSRNGAACRLIGVFVHPSESIQHQAIVASRDEQCD